MGRRSGDKTEELLVLSAKAKPGSSYALYILPPPRPTFGPHAVLTRFTPTIGINPNDRLNPNLTGSTHLWRRGGMGAARHLGHAQPGQRSCCDIHEHAPHSTRNHIQPFSLSCCVARGCRAVGGRCHQGACGRRHRGRCAITVGVRSVGGRARGAAGDACNAASACELATLTAAAAAGGFCRASLLASGKACMLSSGPGVSNAKPVVMARQASGRHTGRVAGVTCVAQLHLSATATGAGTALASLRGSLMQHDRHDCNCFPQMQAQAQALPGYMEASCNAIDTTAIACPGRRRRRRNSPCQATWRLHAAAHPVHSVHAQPCQRLPPSLLLLLP